MSLIPYYCPCLWTPAMITTVWTSPYMIYWTEDFGNTFLDSSYGNQRYHVPPMGQPYYQQPPAIFWPGEQFASDKSVVQVDTRNFIPGEISVLAYANSIVIHAKREEQPGDHGCYVKREFTRRYVLPDDVDPQTVKCQLMPDGMLCLEVPRKRWG